MKVNYIKTADLNYLHNLVMKLQVYEAFNIFSACPKPCMKMDIKIMKTGGGSNMKDNSILILYNNDEITWYKEVLAYDFFNLLVDLGSALGK